MKGSLTKRQNTNGNSLKTEPKLGGKYGGKSATQEKTILTG